MPTSRAAVTLPRGERLRRAAEFQAVFQHGNRHERPSFVALWRRANGRRVGFAVSRQLRGAVKRNRARRRIRAAYREIRAQMAPNVEVVVVARANAGTRPFPELVEDMRRLAEALTDRSRATTV
ncbi:MAG TPA: ribonuclease P protein component [Methylomirabilota bacterium]|nr:ribonuclease P protein component [Methylomirabilota bacterium]